MKIRTKVVVPTIMLLILIEKDILKERQINKFFHFTEIILKKKNGKMIKKTIYGN